MCSAWIRSDGRGAPGYGTLFVKISAWLAQIFAGGLARSRPCQSQSRAPVRDFLDVVARRIELGLAGTLAKSKRPV